MFFFLDITRLDKNITGNMIYFKLFKILKHYLNIHLDVCITFMKQKSIRYISFWGLVFLWPQKTIIFIVCNLKTKFHQTYIKRNCAQLNALELLRWHWTFWNLFNNYFLFSSIFFNKKTSNFNHSYLILKLNCIEWGCA